MVEIPEVFTGGSRWPSARASGEWDDWRWQQSQRMRDLDAILAAVGTPALKSDIVVAMRAATDQSALGVSPYYLALADPSDPRDPILPQVLPAPEELELEADPVGVPDPFRERALAVVPGLVHRYPDRALLLLTNYCGTLCRHCMRKREWARGFYRLDAQQVEDAVDAIAARPQIREVILSGGDPLNLPASFLGQTLRALRSRTDLDSIRIGSRVPVTLPQRVDSELLGVLDEAAPVYLNTHFNHAREVTPESTAAVRRLMRAGVVVSNQGVLLRGVNDTIDDLLGLSRALLRAGVRSYYLHHCDPVAGVRHFRVGLGRALQLISQLNGQVGGLAIPRLMVDLPGGGGKVVADGPALLDQDGDTFRYRSPIDGSEVDVDGTEGTFAGFGSWLERTAAGR